MAPPPAPVLLLGQGFKGRDRLAPVGQSRVAAGGVAPGLLLNRGDLHDEGVTAAASNATPLGPGAVSPGR